MQFYIDETKNRWIECEWKKTRNAFKHTATLFNNGAIIEEVKICYQNRTWERFEFESVINKLLDKAELFTGKEERKGLLNHAEAKTDNPFKAIAMIAKIGEIMTSDKKGQNDWKKRMLNAGLENSGISFPEDWDQLSEEEKETRLNGAISSIA